MGACGADEMVDGSMVSKVVAVEGAAAQPREARVLACGMPQLEVGEA